MFSTPTAPAASRLPKDAAVLDPDWGEVHRIVKQIVSKRFEPGPGTLGINSPSFTNYRVTTICNVEFNSRIEPASVDGVDGKRCPTCWSVMESAA